MNFNLSTRKPRSWLGRFGVLALALLITMSSLVPLSAYATDATGEPAVSSESGGESVPEVSAGADYSDVDIGGGGGGTKSLSEIVDEVGIRDDIQVGYDHEIEGSYAVTLSETENGRLVFEDGRQGTKWFMPGDKVYITGVPEVDGYSMINMTVSGEAVDELGDNVTVPVDAFYNLMGSFEMPTFNVDVSAFFWKPYVSDDNLDVAETSNDDSVFGDVGTVREYIETHLDSDYIVSDGSFVLSEYAHVKHTFADREKAGGAELMDDVFEIAGVEAVFYQSENMLPVFDLSTSSDYYVAWVSNYQGDENWSVTDFVFTRDNTSGTVLDGCHFDNATGLAYIPKDLYAGFDELVASGGTDISTDDLLVQCQLFIMNDEGHDFDLSSATLPIYLSVDGNVDMTSFNRNSVVYGAVADTYLAVPLVTDSSFLESVDWRDLVVYVDGLPVSTDMWSYNSDTGVLMIEGGAAAHHGIDVYVRRLSLLERISDVAVGNFRATDVLDAQTDVGISHLSYFETGLDVSVDDISDFVDVDGSNPGIDLQATTTQYGMQMRTDVESVEFTGDPGSYHFIKQFATSFTIDAYGDQYVELVNNGSSSQRWLVFKQRGLGNTWTINGNTYMLPPDEKSYGHPQYPSPGLDGWGNTINLVANGGSANTTWKSVTNNSGSIMRYCLYDGVPGGPAGNQMTVHTTTGTRLAVDCHCSHTNVLNGYGSADGHFTSHIRVIEAGDDWAIIGFANSVQGGQEAAAVILVPIKPSDVYVGIEKKIAQQCVQNHPLYQDLSGIQFSIIDSSTGAQVGTMVTDSSGRAVSDKLKYNNGAGFDIVETSIPSGLPLVLNSTPVHVSPDPKTNDSAAKALYGTITNQADLDPPRLNLYKKLSNGMMGSLDKINNGLVSTEGVKFKVEYCYDNSLTVADANAKRYASVFEFEVKTVKNGNMATMDFMDRACFVGDAWDKCKNAGYYRSVAGSDRIAFPPGALIFTEISAPGQELYDGKLVFIIEDDVVTDYWLDGDGRQVKIRYDGITVDFTNDPTTVVIEVPKVDDKTKKGEGQGDAVLDATFELLVSGSEDIVVGGRTFRPGDVICEMKTEKVGNELIARLPDWLNGPYKQGDTVIGKGLVAGDYLLREKEVGPDYKKTFPDYPFRISTDDVEATGDGGLFNIFKNSKWSSGAENEVKKAGVRVPKVDAERYQDGQDDGPSGNGSLNATFEVINRSERAVVINGTTYAPGQVCYTGQAKSSGSRWLFETAVVFPVGTYEIRESVAATGYHIGSAPGSPAWSATFTVTEADDGKIIDIDGGPVANGPKRGGFSICKTDIYRVQTAPSGDESRPEGNASFGQMVFSITNRSANSVKYKGQWYAPGQVMDTITTDNNGTYTSGNRDLPYGTYEFREVQAPEGYLLDTNWVGTVTITEEGVIVPVNGYTSNTNPLANTPMKGGLEVHKYTSEIDRAYAEGDTKLEGAVFSIYNLSDEQVYCTANSHWADPATGHTRDTMADHNVTQSNWVMDITTNTDGVASTGDRMLPYGTYCVVETKAPEGFHLNTSWHRIFTITADGQWFVYDDVRQEQDMNNSTSATGAVPEAPKRGGVRIHKSDDNRINSNPQGDEDRPQGDASFKEARFLVYNRSAHSVYVPDPTKPNNHDECDVMGNPLNGAKFVEVQPGGLVATLVTDEQGIAETGPKCLPYGTYEIIEDPNGAPEGYLVDTDWHDVFTVRDSTTEIIQEHHSYTVNPIEEPVIRGGVTVKKVDVETHNEKPDLPQGDATLAGAQYSIYNASKADVYVRGENGQFKWVDPTTIDAVRGVEIHDVDHPEDDLPEASCVWRGTTNDKGELTTTTDLLPYGTYIIRETKPSQGYNLNNDWAFVFSVRENGKIYNKDDDDSVSSEVTDPDNAGVLDGTALAPEKVIRGGVRIEKWDWELNRSEALASSGHDDEKNGADGHNLAGMTFGIWNVSQRHVEVEDETGSVNINDPNGTYTDVSKCILKIVTHWDDEVKAYVADTTPDALPYGTYIIREIDRDSDKAYFKGDGTEQSKNNHPVFTFIVRNEGEIVTKFTNCTVSGDQISNENGEQDKVMRVKNRLHRGELQFVKKKGDSQGSLAAMFVLTHAVSGERHVIVTDRNGQFDSERVAHSNKTNANDRFLEAIDNGEVIKMADADLDAGIWFGIGEDGTEAAVRDDFGALYYGRYYVKEVKTDTTADYEMIAPDFYIYIDKKDVDPEISQSTQGYKIDLGTLTDSPGPHIKSTSASDGNTGLTMGIAGDEAIIVDAVQVADAKPNTKYKFVLKLMDKETGRVITWLDEEGNEVEAVAESVQTLRGGDAEVPMEIKVPGSAVAGKNIVCYEIMYDANGVNIVSSHTDIVDDAQRVRYPSVGTTVLSNDTKDHDAPSTGVIKLTDTVEYNNVVAGQNYVLTGTLINKATGEPIKDADGQDIVAVKKFKAEKESGIETVEFEFDASLVKGQTLVVFESLTYNGIEVGVHADLEDEGQTIWFPEIHTTAVDTSTDTNQGVVSDKVIISDKVYYNNLVVGSKYVVNGTLMHKLTGTPMVDSEGNQITATLEFVPVESEGFVTLTFELDSRELAGQDVVVFESLVKNGIEVAIHAELKDENQTVHYPEIHTNAGYGETHEKDGMATTEVTITDIVSYKNLKPGEEYTVNGTLMDKNTGGPILDAEGNQIHGTTTFVPEESSGEVEVTFTFDATGLEGMTTVVYESLVYKNVEIYIHSDLEDEDQTVYFPKIRTTLTEMESGIHEALATTKVTLVDTVKYWNLTPGETYIMKGTLRDKDTGEVIRDAKGHEVTAETEFVPENPDGSVDVVFEFDGSILAGKTVVAFESLDHYGREVAVHADLEDEDQTVRFPDMSSVLCKYNDKGVPDPTEKTLKLGNDIEFVDVVTYHNLVPGNSYRMEGTLMRKSNGTQVMGRDGQPVKTSVSFRPDNADGEIEVPFIIDTGMFAGDYIVAYQRLYAVTTEKILIDDIEMPEGNDTEVTFLMDDGETEFFKTYGKHVDDFKTWEKEMPEFEGLQVPEKEPGEDGTEYKFAGWELVSSEQTKDENDKDMWVVSFKAVFEAVDDEPVTSEPDASEPESSSEPDTNETESDDEPDMTNPEDIVVNGLSALMDIVTFADEGDGETAGESAVDATPEPDADASPASDTDVDVEPSTEPSPEPSDEPGEESGEESGNETAVWYYGNGNGYAVFKNTDGEVYFVGRGYSGVDFTSWADNMPVVDGLVVPVKADDEDGTRYVFDHWQFTGMIDIPATGSELTNEELGIPADVTVTNMPDEASVSRNIADGIAALLDVDDATIVRAEFEPVFRAVTVEPGTEHTVTWYDEDETTVLATVTMGADEVDIPEYPGEIPAKEPDEDGTEYVFDKWSDAKTTMTGDIYFVAVYREKTDEDLPPDVEPPKYEELIKETLIGLLEDINDKDETMDFELPVVHTMATGAASNDHTLGVAEKVTIIDEVFYEGLCPGSKYTLTGHLVDRSNGQYILDKDNKPIEVTMDFWPETEVGSVKMEFEVDTTKLAGKQIVVYETLFFNEIKLVVHEDLTDKDQTVEVKRPEIHTTATAKDDKSKEVDVSTTTVIHDEVKYTGLVPGNEYTMTGRLIDAGTGDEIKGADGKPVTSEVKFTAEKAEGSVMVEFVVDTTALVGKQIVVYEKLFSGTTVIATHEDRTDESQTVTVKKPEIKTMATGSSTETHDIEIGKSVTIKDTVSYKNLTKGQAYTINGKLMDKATNKPLKDAEGKEITGTKSFVAPSSEGTVEVTFTFDTENLSGMAVVVFEQLVCNGNIVGVHEDITDLDQTVRVPKIRTKIRDKITEHEMLTKGNETVVVDRVMFENLVPGTKYTLVGTLMDKSTGDVLRDEYNEPVMTEHEFTAKDYDGYEDIEFTIDTTKLENTTLVAFELLKVGDTVIARHENLEDKEQTAYVCKIRTTAHDETKQSQVIPVTQQSRIIDTVAFENLAVGHQYKMVAKVVDKANGAFIKDARGNDVTAEVLWTPVYEWGNVDVLIELDARELEGHTLVVYEYLYDMSGSVIASHEDIDDDAQAVSVGTPKEPTPDNPTPTPKPQTPSNGTPVDVVTGVRNASRYAIMGMAGCLALAIAIAVGLGIRRNRQRRELGNDEEDNEN